MGEEVKELLLDVRTYLNYQRLFGNEYLPCVEVGKTENTVMSKSEKAKELEEVRNFIGDCTRCRLSKERTHVVFGEGNSDADLMFVGEGPGADEDQQGRPFVGRAGKLLTKIIGAMGFSREETYIANIVKCRPPENRNPETDEIATCSPFLLKQIGIIRPKVIVCLGGFSTQTLLSTDEKISKLRGKFVDWNPPGMENLTIKVIPTYHPAFLLRNPNMKKPVWEDMKKVMRELGSGK